MSSKRNSRNARGWAGAAAAAAVALVLSGCGTSGEPASTPGSDGDLPELDAAYAAELDGYCQTAIDEGETEVVFYGTNVAKQDPLYEAFNRRYPDIEVKPVRLSGAELTSKLEQEVASGNKVADLVVSSGSTQYPRSQKGWFEEFVPPTVTDDLNELGYRDHGFYFAPSLTPFGIGFNTSELTEQTAPQGWDDLLDPALDGKITTVDPTKPGSVAYQLMVLGEGGVIDDAWLQSLAEMDTIKVGLAPEVVQTLATGQAIVGIGVSMSDLMEGRDSGAPVDLVFPTEGGVAVTPDFVALMDGAPHPDAAKCFYSWMFTPEAQSAFSELALYPMVEGSPAPEGYPPLEELDIVPLPSDEDAAVLLNEYVSKLSEIFG